MPHIDSTRFGEITVDGKKYHQVLIAGDRVEERDYDRLTGLFGTSHRIGDWEVEAIFAGDPEALVIGTGQSGMLEVRADISARAAEKEIAVITALTPEAIKVYNEKTRAGRHVNALIHTTC